MLIFFKFLAKNDSWAKGVNIFQIFIKFVHFLSIASVEGWSSVLHSIMPCTFTLISYSPLCDLPFTTIQIAFLSSSKCLLPQVPWLEESSRLISDYFFHIASPISIPFLRGCSTMNMVQVLNQFIIYLSFPAFLYCFISVCFFFQHFICNWHTHQNCRLLSGRVCCFSQ